MHIIICFYCNVDQKIIAIEPLSRVASQNYLNYFRKRLALGHNQLKTRPKYAWRNYDKMPKQRLHRSPEQNILFEINLKHYLIPLSFILKVTIL